MLSIRRRLRALCRMMIADVGLCFKSRTRRFILYAYLTVGLCVCIIYILIVLPGIVDVLLRWLRVRP
jgi:hypothetical protein